ncbi:hypothetical protein [Helicobacter sp. MIT 99-5507]|uniref:hypothetical protein n=1 Tax=Helicobacter sp. MIT 99-5507 TaxID=152489 RepID=UPI000E1EEE7D|nr:hypothetical protein [Helicobacter sp. MIT 99-5507]RDU58023.1 hypothetical protein CQA42_03750 [Helicobacter sp. MIT 99-5507]
MDLGLRADLILNGKRIQISIECINKNAKSEVEALFAKQNLDIKDILKAYIKKAQEYAELEDKLRNLTNQLEQI